MQLKAPDHNNLNYGKTRIFPGELVEVAAADVEALKRDGWTEAKKPKPAAKKAGDK